MARPRSPQRDKAYQIWLESDFKIKLKDIAAELDVPENRIRKWKSEDKWEQKAKGTLPKNKGNAPKKKRGAPKGNRNAVGNNGGAPLGSSNARTHGGYSAVYWDTLSEEEQELIKSMPQSEEELLYDQLKLFSVQERRLLTAIKKVKDATLTLKNDDGKEISIDDRVMDSATVTKSTTKNGEYQFSSSSKSVNYEHKDNRLLRLQQQLTTVQRAKTKAIDSLIHMNIEKQKLDMLRDNAVTETEDTSETDGVIYGE